MHSRSLSLSLFLCIIRLRQLAAPGRDVKTCGSLTCLSLSLSFSLALVLYFSSGEALSRRRLIPPRHSNTCIFPTIDGFFLFSPPTAPCIELSLSLSLLLRHSNPSICTRRKHQSILRSRYSKRPFEPTSCPLADGHQDSCSVDNH